MRIFFEKNLRFLIIPFLCNNITAKLAEKKKNIRYTAPVTFHFSAKIVYSKNLFHVSPKNALKRKQVKSHMYQERFYKNYFIEYFESIFQRNTINLYLMEQNIKIKETRYIKELLQIKSHF